MKLQICPFVGTISPTVGVKLQDTIFSYSYSYRNIEDFKNSILPFKAQRDSLLSLLYLHFEKYIFTGPPLLFIVYYVFICNV